MSHSNIYTNTYVGVLILSGSALPFGLLAVCNHFCFATGERLSQIWAGIGFFGALANMLNAPLVGDADLAQYVLTAPQRQETFHIGMLAIGSVHALFPFSRRMEIGIALWVFFCAICQNAILYRRTNDLSLAFFECLGVIIPFTTGMAITEVAFYGMKRGAVSDVEVDEPSAELLTPRVLTQGSGRTSRTWSGSLAPGTMPLEDSTLDSFDDELCGADQGLGSAKATKDTSAGMCSVSVELLQIDWSARLGSGAMGDVHLGAWLGTSVAVKVVRDKRLVAAGSGGSERCGPTLQKEAKLLSQLRHPCICSIFGMVELDGGAEAIVLEYMNGGTLFDLLYRRRSTAGGGGDTSASTGTSTGTWTNAGGGEAASCNARGLSTDSAHVVSTAIACRLSRETASGLAYLHANGYMHREYMRGGVCTPDSLRHVCICSLRYCAVCTCPDSPALRAPAWEASSRAMSSSTSICTPRLRTSALPSSAQPPIAAEAERPPRRSSILLVWSGTPLAKRATPFASGPRATWLRWVAFPRRHLELQRLPCSSTRTVSECYYLLPLPLPAFLTRPL